MTALAVVAIGAAALGCNPDDPNQLGSGTGQGGGCEVQTSGTGTTTGEGGGTTSTTTSTGTGQPDPTILDKRELSYTEALRTASLKLVGALPTMDQVRAVEDAADPKAEYEAQIDDMMNDVRFKTRMIEFWRNELRIGGTAAKETAPTFAARITVEGRPYSDMFTATTNTCPTFNGTDFVDGSCTNANPTAGVLTNPGVLAHYSGNLAFRRVRFFQEAFACHKQPAELSNMPIQMGAGDYTAPWPFESIAGTANGGRLDFLDTSSAICANCHATSNHRAPLFAFFDGSGVQQTTIQVNIPITGVPVAVMDDWLPPGETTAYKFGQDAADLAEFGQHMAQDEEVLQCAVSRIWNFAMSKGDIVNDAAAVPTTTIATLVDEFHTTNGNLRKTVRSVFTHDDFVRF
jgi:hypothetical protein